MHKALPLVGILLVAASLPVTTTAKRGAPHSLTAKASYSKVTMNWQAPDAPKQLMRHNGRDYDGDAGIATSPQHPAVIYIGADFPAADLIPGEVITSLNYFEYRPIAGLTAIIWEDGTIVREQKGDLAGYKANQWRTVTFSEPYTIPEGKNIRIGFKLEHGTNLDFVAIMDDACDKRGDLRSYDGTTWEHNGRGTYLITANLRNEVDEAPTGYSVYAGSTLVADNLQATTFTLTDQPDGTRAYRVEAEYGSERYGVEKQATTKSVAQFMPGPRLVTAERDANSARVKWQAPLFRGNDNLLTWHSSNDTLANAIGGTASSNTKVWIKNDFKSADLVSFAGADIQAIRAQFHEKTMTSLIAWVMKDGAFVQYDTVPQSVIDGIVVDQWVSLPLSQPVKIEPGSNYSYGYYMMHTPKTHPVSVNSGVKVGSKADSFSTSSPNSSNFANSKPSWKTLASGNIAGNWMLAAELNAAPADSRDLIGFNIYYEGVFRGMVEADKNDAIGYVVPKPGKYTYGVQTVGTNGIVSEIVESTVTVPHNSSYVAPTIANAEFDRKNGKVTFDITMDRTLQHYGDATYKAGFDEAMTLNWGARFNVADLESYHAWRIKKINFIIGEKVPTGFKLQMHKTDGTLIKSFDIGADQVNPLGMYSLTLDNNEEYLIDEDDFIISYQADLPAKCSAIVLDNGPLVSGGAIVKIAGTTNWLNLGTINSTYNNYNIVIGATCVKPMMCGAPAQSMEIGATGIVDNLKCVELKASELRSGLGVEAVNTTVAQRPRTAGSGIPFDPKCYYIYRNGEKIATLEENKFSDIVPDHDIYTYQVSGLYSQEWESQKSSPLVIDNGVEQASPAPYDLKVVNTTSLEWKAPQAAPVMTYCTADPKSYGVGMTGGTTRTTYAMQKFPVDSIARNAGNLVSHIRFGLYSTNLTYASVIVIKDLNIIYEQEIPVDSLKAVQAGWNEIRLNQPVELEAGHEYMFGYRLDYLTGEKPMLFDAGPAVNNYGNLISATASHTSWKSLKSLNSSLNGNWRIYTTLMKPASLTRDATRQADGITYNLYRNGIKLQEGIATTTVTPQWLPDASNHFTVTAVVNGVESAHSNVAGNDHAGVDGIDATAAIWYDRATRTLVTELSGVIYNAAGHQVASIEGDTELSWLLPGTYIFRADDGQVVKFIR